LWFAAAAVVLVAGGAAWYLSRGHRPRAVFLIVVDTLRADRLSCYGNGRNATSHIDSLAASGVQFDEAIANGAWTVPSMGALMTSLYPTELGLVEVSTPPHSIRWKEPRDQIEHTIALDFTTLAEIFSDAGYHTAAFVNQPILNSRDGFAQGFAEWFYPVTEDTILERDPSTPLRDLDVTDRRRANWEATHGADSTLVDAFTSWMDTLSTHDDVFVWIHLFSPHRPYRPPARYLPPEQRGLADSETLTLAQRSLLYDGEVRWSDALVGSVLDLIRRKFKERRPLVVFTADHGEEFGEHGHYDHGHSVHRECVHVPLIMAGPGFPAATRVASHVRLIDVLPTILERCGLASAAPAGVEGESLLPVVKGDGGDRTVYTEGMLYGSTKRSLLEGEFRLIWDRRDDSKRLFRISDDPGETRDVGAQSADVRARLYGEMDALHRRLEGDYKTFLSARADVDSATAAAERERTLKAMKSLGYVGN